MYWHEDNGKKRFTVPTDIIDLAFSIVCRCLPPDHAYALSRAVCAALPWLEQEERAGVHLLHGAESGHGWRRPEDSDAQMLHLSRRTKLVLRLPQERVGDARIMTGTTLDVDGYSIEVGAAAVRPLSAWTTLFARHVAARADQGEQEFLEQAVRELAQTGIAARKLLCGKSHALRLPEGELFTRRLMIADLAPQDAVKLQQQGLGPGRKMGCGLFIPHKGIAAMGEAQPE